MPDILRIVLATICVVAAVVGRADSQSRPNVLFIAVDDLNDWVGHLGGHPNARTPNIDRLAKRGVSFANAYCSAPLCNPSRVSLLTSIQPSRSGVYGNGEKFRNKLPDAVTLMQHLRFAGYVALGTGKIFHGRTAGDAASWDEYFVAANDRAARFTRPDVSKDAWINWGPLPVEDSALADAKSAEWTVRQLKRDYDKPFFLACGMTKPHMPWFVPQEYFDMHPLEAISLPDVPDADLDDVPPFGQRLAREVYDPSGQRNFAQPGGDHQNILKHHQWAKAVQGYLATISFADAQVGRILDALDASDHADNTMIVLWGDHGWHLGEKQHWRKHALWEVSTRTPLVICWPKMFGGGRQCRHPVSLIDLYPTIVELCGVAARDGIDGQSLVPLLQDPDREWNRPALTTYGSGNHSIRTARWRYIRYHDGGEELYDHRRDPKEWTNVAAQAKHQATIDALRKLLPKTNAPTE